MTALAPLALVCGLALGLGLWLLVSLVPRFGRPALVARVAPYVMDVSADARQLLDRQTADPLPLFRAIVDPVIGGAHRALSALAGDNDAIRGRLRQTGTGLSVDEFRLRQLAWGASGVGLGAIAAVVIGSVHATPPGVNVALVVVAGISGFVCRDYLLKRAAVARTRRISKELPTVLEFMTLSLSAGEGVLDAIRRVSRISHGEFAAELAAVVSEVSSGLPLAESLTTLSSQLQLPALSRAIEQIVGALERGTPLADVLRAQAQDARDDAKRELLELSGKKEVAMLVPLVFLILPTTIAIAIFPGIFVLQLGI